MAIFLKIFFKFWKKIIRKSGITFFVSKRLGSNSTFYLILTENFSCVEFFPAHTCSLENYYAFSLLLLVKRPFLINLWHFMHLSHSSMHIHEK